MTAKQLTSRHKDVILLMTAVGLTDATTDRVARNGTLRFHDSKTNTYYTLNATSGMYRRVYGETGLSYQLNKKRKVRGQTTVRVREYDLNKQAVRVATLAATYRGYGA